MTERTRLSAEDRLDIMDLIARYAYTLDSGDLDGYVNNFAPTACCSRTTPGATRSASTWPCSCARVAPGRCPTATSRIGTSSARP